MNKDLFEKITELNRDHKNYVIATVIMVRGSSSGKVGDKAIFGEDGRRIMGFIGGGCIENRVSRTALEAINDGEPKIVNINLDSDEIGMGIPCGGHMSIIVEPQIKSPTFLVRGMGRVVEVLAELGYMLNFRVVVQTPEEEKSRFHNADEIITKPLELDDLEFNVDYFLLVTHHRDDDKMSLKALQMGIPFVAVVASRKKAGLLVDYLKKNGVSDSELERFHSPAGLNLNAKNAEEIALSIMSEMVLHRNGGTGLPMGKTKV